MVCGRKDPSISSTLGQPPPPPSNKLHPSIFFTQHIQTHTPVLYHSNTLPFSLSASWSPPHLNLSPSFHPSLKSSPSQAATKKSSPKLAPPQFLIANQQQIQANRISLSPSSEPRSGSKYITQALALCKLLEEVHGWPERRDHQWSCSLHTRTCSSSSRSALLTLPPSQWT